ncbi:MAG: hypothetical protein HYU76_00310 [Betaproteobacteria bacterium]|nr:hypothetical protein [Betaproteobacteria bacterium]
MSTKPIDPQRRSWLHASLAGVVGGLLLWRARHAVAAEKASLLAKPVPQLPTDPNDPAWASADVLEVPLAPQAVVKPRTYEAGVKTLTVRAVYAGDRMAILIAWRDAERDAMEGGVHAFRDAVAVEFPSDPGKGIPFFGMGEAERPVTIYQWKADWEPGAQRDVDEKYPHMAVDWYPYSGRQANEIAEAADYGKQGGDKAFIPSWWVGNPLADPALQARTAVEKLTANGFGTIAPLPPDKQDGQAKAVWKDGVWRTVIVIPRAQEKFSFEPGKTLPVAFAAWNGAKHERGGEKAVSTWYFLSLEQPVGVFTYVAPLVAVAGAAAVQLAGLHGLRARRTPGGRRRSFGAALQGWIGDLRAKLARRGKS